MRIRRGIWGRHHCLRAQSFPSEKRGQRAEPELRPLGSVKVWKWAILLLCAGYLLFAHGCHPDEDDELFAPRLLDAFVWRSNSAAVKVR
jgi:hypothetical protein